MSPITLGIGLVAIILTISALSSGLVERAPLSFPIIFLGLGFLVGPLGANWIEIDLRDPLLEAVCVVTLSLVLFLDAVKIRLDEMRSDWYIPALTLGPGTLLFMGGMAVAAYYLFDLGAGPQAMLMALLLGATLASTDPVVLRDIVQDDRVPRSIRRALGVEAGMNDIVILPIVLIVIALLTGHASSAGGWLLYLAQLLVVSPLVGMVVGGAGAWLMATTDARFTIRTEFQALYGIGLVLAAYSAGQAVQGSGFVAAFFGGLAVTIFNMNLCECFLEYGEITAQMMMLLAFVLFGAVLSETLALAPLWPALALAAIALLAVRPLAILLVLSRVNMSNSARLFIGWFGPRGLTSLLLVLLAVQSHVPNAEFLLAIAGVVVVVSVLAHGISATPLSTVYARHVSSAPQTLAEERESSFIGLFDPEAEDIQRITPEELAARLASDDPPIVLDVRSRSQYDNDDGQIPGSIRVVPDEVMEWASKRLRDRSVVAYCT